MGATDLILRAGQLAVAIAGFYAVVRTLRQKDASDNRSEWWTRYAWAVEHITDRSPTVQEVAWLNLEVLSESPLATATEARLIQALAEPDIVVDNEEALPEGQER
ncbi:hypothetical protein [Corynebacterium bovis]|uniref:hypothetical protein n=1 Tax=Corynebacterium bovis TaxID=36808 RepID=UPI000F63A30A|nr:hypothetical protein [Corynebacterium bovis]